MAISSPYALGIPVTRPESFFGRKAQVDRFFSRISQDQTQPLHLIGARRTGKTSFLLHVSDSRIAAPRLSASRKQPVIVYVDLLELEEESPIEFRKLIVRALSGADPHPPSLDEICSRYDGFQAWLAERMTSRRLVILVDEFDRIVVSKSFDRDFFCNLRALAQSGVVWVTSSMRNLYQACSMRGPDYHVSPFCNVFDPEPLVMGRLETRAADELVARPAEGIGVRLDSREIDAIREIAGDFPYYLQVVADKWLRMRDQNTSIRDCRTKILDELLSPGNLIPAQLESCWRNLTFREQKVLRRAAAGQDLPAGTLEKDARDNLVQLDLLVEGDRGLRPAGDLFGRWIRESAASAPGTPRVFVGHGHSKDWMAVKIFLQEHLHLETISYQSSSRVSSQIVAILEEFLDQADYAVLVLTAEDRMDTGRDRARQNVVHEVGLMQGRLGFHRVVLLMQRGVEGFSNLEGMQVIEFDPDRIDTAFLELGQYFQAEGVVG